ncbi:MAG: HIT family protein [Bacteroidales bacterium]|nr:HIT family protein [Bacteroidales bacterium]
MISRRHVIGYFQLTGEEWPDLWDMVDRVREHLHEKFSSDGFNVGSNENMAAGQTTFHFYLHIIPRYEGDVEDPTGWVRNVITGKGKYG